jgi:hypothetical protein
MEQRMRALSPRAAVLVLAMILAGCNSVPFLPITCARPGIPSIVVQIRDDAGKPAAIGTTVLIRNRAGYSATEEGYGDSLRVSVGETEGGTFDVRVTKPWHAAAILSDVKVPADACGVERPREVSLVLTRLPGAPAVRQVVAAPFGYGFGWGNLSAQLVAYVEADPGVSREVEWVSRDSTVARVTRGGNLTSVCRSTPGSTWVVASAVADRSVSDSISVGVSADQDPQRCPAR